MRDIFTQNTSGVHTKQLSKAYKAFKQIYPAYEATMKINEIRGKEYSRLDKTGQVYLDYTG